MKTETLRVENLESGRGAIASAVERLRAGEPVVLPTETVYGLAALPSAEAALRATKDRDAGKPITWAVASREAAERLVHLEALGPQKLARRYWPGPLTLVLPQRDGAPGATLGVRVPGHPVALAVLQALDAPLLLTSANRSGRARLAQRGRGARRARRTRRARARRRSGAARPGEHGRLLRRVAADRAPRRGDRSRHGAAHGGAHGAARVLGQHLPQPDGEGAAQADVGRPARRETGAAARARRAGRERRARRGARPARERGGGRAARGTRHRPVGPPLAGAARRDGARGRPGAHDDGESPARSARRDAGGGIEGRAARPRAGTTSPIPSARESTPIATRSWRSSARSSAASAVSPECGAGNWIAAP